MPASITLQNSLLNAVLRNVPYPSPGTVYLALYTTDPTVNDVGTEVAGGAYQRVSVSFAAPVSGSCVNFADVNVPNMPAITVVYLGIRTASSGGTLLFSGPLANPKTTNVGDTFLIRAGDLAIVLV